MSIYAISDLHLSFNTNKPMNIFGWEDYEDKIKEDWKEKVTENDLVLLPGDFSWEMKLENTYKDFEFINLLPGKKILLKGNHDYWWNTLLKMERFLEENNLNNIFFLHNNSYKFENTIISGTRGWSLIEEDDENNRIRNREVLRLELSINDGIKKYGKDKEIIVCMHYPPLSRNYMNTDFTKILEKYNVSKCIYGHLHGKTQEEGITGRINNVEYIMASCDYTDFKLIKIK